MSEQPLTRDLAEVMESLGRTLEAKAKKEAMPNKKNYKPLTRAQNKLLDASVVIFGEPATKKDAAFIARELVQASLPHKNPGDVPVWTRRNGNTSLSILPGRNSKTGERWLPLRHHPTSVAVLDDDRSHPEQGQGVRESAPP